MAVGMFNHSAGRLPAFPRKRDNRSPRADALKPPALRRQHRRRQGGALCPARLRRRLAVLMIRLFRAPLLQKSVNGTQYGMACAPSCQNNVLPLQPPPRDGGIKFRPNKTIVR